MLFANSVPAPDPQPSPEPHLRPTGIATTARFGRPNLRLVVDNTKDAITILRTPSLWMAKRIWPGRIEQYSQAKHFDISTAPIAGLDDIAELLTGRLINDPHAAIVRAELLDPSKTHHVRRLLHPDRDAGDAATFRDQPHRWVALDIEGIERPASIPATDLVGCARIAIATLPATFHGVRCIVQASASHGIKPDIRLPLVLVVTVDIGR